MSTDRELRKTSTADAGYVLREVTDRGGDVYGEMERRAAECDERGHTWIDPASRRFCTYCGSYWHEDG